MMPCFPLGIFTFFLYPRIVDLIVIDLSLQSDNPCLHFANFLQQLAAVLISQLDFLLLHHFLPPFIEIADFLFLGLHQLIIFGIPFLQQFLIPICVLGHRLSRFLDDLFKSRENSVFLLIDPGDNVLLKD